MIDISGFVPSLETNTNKNQTKPTEPVQTQSTEPVQTNSTDIVMTKECLSYLRIMLLTKMFKENSTRSFKVYNVRNEFNMYLQKYVASYTFNQPLVKVIQSLIDVPDSDFEQELSDLEKRDIINFDDRSTALEYKYVL
jgi:hypothetical protein